jgi:large subunit ribosomal protein L11
MADKKVKQVLKMVIQAGKAQAGPPIGSTLGPAGINLMQFVKEFNDMTASMTGAIPALITIYEDRSYSFVLKTAPVSELIKQALNLASGSGDPLRKKVGKLTYAQASEIAEKKMEDLNCYTVDQAVKMVAGTARSMGVQVEEAAVA